MYPGNQGTHYKLNQIRFFGAGVLPKAGFYLKFLKKGRFDSELHVQYMYLAPGWIMPQIEELTMGFCSSSSPPPNTPLLIYK